MTVTYQTDWRPHQAAEHGVIAVLIAPPGQLDDTALRGVMNAAGLPRSTHVWLSPREACEFPLPPDCGGAVSRIENHLSKNGLNMDFAAVPARGRKKKLLVADMESTIIEQECLDELADFIGLQEKMSAITGYAMNGEIAFEDSLRERVAMLAGLDESHLAAVMERVTYMPGAKTLVRTMRANGAFAALVSGGFSYFASRVAAEIGFDAWRSNMLEMHQGKIAGALQEPVLGRREKRDALRAVQHERGLCDTETLAVGDGANDIDMIRAAGLGVAFRAKPAVAAEAKVSILNGNLTALLFLQGYRRKDFVH